MMGIVDFHDPVGNHKLKLVGPETTGFVCRCETIMCAQKHQDIRRLGNQQIAGFQYRHCEGRMRRLRIIKHILELVDCGFLSARILGDVHIPDSGLLKREPHEFAAPRNAGPVIKLISHTAFFRPRMRRATDG